MSWVECLRKMRTELQQMGYDQIPQLTSSRLIDVNKPMYICPPNSHGRKRAVLIGINYTGQQGQLVRLYLLVYIYYFYLFRLYLLLLSFTAASLFIFCKSALH